MNFMRRSMAATVLIGAGLVGTTGAAFADDDHHDGGTEQTGLANASDIQTIVPTNVCGNNVPVTVLGVQVPVQDVAADVPILSGASNGSTQEGSVNKNCGNFNTKTNKCGGAS